MSQFIGHEPCPDCGGSDPLGRWDDGHGYCFNCGRYERGTNAEKLKRIKELPAGVFTVPCPPLPIDWVITLPEEARNWLQKYGITYVETSKQGFRWSDSHQALIMPVYDDFGTLQFWQIRSFGKNFAKKYLTFGSKEGYDHIIGDLSHETLVLVEDYLSAIKVGRWAAACPLFGSEVSIERKNRLVHKFKSLILWLDFDKRKSAIAWKIANRAFFEKDVNVIWNEKDPKACTDEQIQKQLQGHI